MIAIYQTMIASIVFHKSNLNESAINEIVRI